MGKIVQLDKNLINQIAAGEVIERPMSVVKELVENSIDAGATRISISLDNDCRNIRIADNGSGINEDDIILAFSKHATSKIKNVDDLYNINTLGFRGEALASIISISKLTCTTKTKDAENGIRVECSNSEVSKTKTGCADGTIMDIKDLFYNIPARLKFLKSEKTEFGYIQELVESLAIANPQVSIELIRNGKPVFKTLGANGLKEVIKQLFSKEVSENLKEVLKTDKISNLKISGYTSTPSFTRSSKKDYYLYVNNRMVKCPIIQKAIDVAYRNTLPKGKYPFVVLKLELPPTDVDVNVHPTKKEVRYQNTNQVFNFIVSAIMGALANNIEEPTKEETIENEPSKIVSFEEFVNAEPTAPAGHGEEDDEVVFIPVNSVLPRSTYKRPEPLRAEPPSFKQHSIVSQRTVSELKQEDTIIGQYKKTYILIEREEGLEIVDQHIADERYIYEKLKASQTASSQILFISDILPVNHEEAELLKENKALLEKYGYGIEFINTNEVTFKKLPTALASHSTDEILRDLLENISGDVNGIEEKILITTSCKSAVKANTSLNLFQMQEIIRNWRGCTQPYTCPHGRPISKILKHEEIAKFFMRQG